MKWISIKHEKPDIGLWVLCTDGQYVWTAKRLGYKESYNDFENWRYGNPSYDFDVSDFYCEIALEEHYPNLYWMPIPEELKLKGDDNDKQDQALDLQ